MASSARDPNDRPTARQFCDGLRILLNPVSEPKQQSVSPALRARSLFGEAAARNRRDLEVAQLNQKWCQDAARHWESNWKETIESLGWQTGRISGGSGGYHIQTLAANWQMTCRFFFSGKIEGEKFEIALTFRRQELPGESRLPFGFTIAIQHQKNPRVPAISEDCESIIVSRDFETFTKGPQVESVFNEILSTIGAAEYQFRTLEQLKKLVDD